MGHLIPQGLMLGSTRRWLTVATAMVGTLALVIACSSDDPAGGRSRAEDGPLSAGLEMGGGEAALYAPAGVDSWSGTFGSALLCSRDGSEITLDSIEYTPGVEPLATVPIIRTVPPLGERRGRGTWEPEIKRVGSPPRLASAPHLIGGSLSEDIGGTEISQQCARPPDPDAGFTELLTVLTGDASGASVTGFSINYTSGGNAYSLPIDWTFALCGSQLQELCGPPPG